MIIATGILLMVAAIPGNTQIPNTMYFMPGVPQSNRINPSIQPGCGFYLGFPGLAPLRFQVSSSSLGWSDLFYAHPDPSIDSLITPFHPMGDKQGFLDQLNDVNYMLAGMGTSLASVGFRAGKNFISLDLTTRVDGNVYYPKGAFDLLFNGAPDGSVITLSGLGADMNVFNEASLGWSRKDFILPGLDIGVRGKALFGLANLDTRSSEFNITTSMEVWNVQSDMQFNVAGPSFVNFTEGFEDGPPVEIDSTFFNQLDYRRIRSTVFDWGQFGLALDAGVSYRPFRQLLISASVMDIGGINWSNAAAGSFDFEYDFEGIEVNPFTGMDTTMISELTDSLMNAVTFVTGQPYFARLNTKIFVGVSYYPVERIGFGLLSRTDFLGEQPSQQFTGSVNMTTGKFINLSLTGSYMSNSFNNIGAGVSFNVGPFNMYLISDNIISGALKPLDTRSFSFWFGMNLAFNWNMFSRSGSIDRPLIR
jgi:hypothetical protein